MERYAGALMITFFIYGFAGWIWESFICPILTGNKIKNSGFLIGPIVPIYGFGALLVSLLLSPHENLLTVFIEGAFVACVVEYLTSWAMETFYHRRWWDYSDKAFNVNGRVCLEGFLVFGFFSVLAVKYIQPFLMSQIMTYDTTLLVGVATTLSIIFFVDFIVTIVSLMHLEERIDTFMKDVEEYAQKALSDFETNRKNLYEIIETMKISDLPGYQGAIKHKKLVEKRILKAFPHLINKNKK